MSPLRAHFRSSYQGVSDYTVYVDREPRRFSVRTDLPDFKVEQVRNDARYTVEEREQIIAHYLALVGTVVAHDGRQQFPPAEVVQAIAAEMMAKGYYAEPLVLVGARHTGGYGVEYDGAPPETPIRAGGGLTMPVLGRWWLKLYSDRKVAGGAS